MTMSSSRPQENEVVAEAPARPEATTRLRHKHLLGIADLTPDEILLVLDTATAMQEIAHRPIKKVPTLRGRTVVNLFFEPSTRTRTSFEVAEKRLSADTLNVACNPGSGFAVAGVLSQRPQQPVQAGQWVTVRTLSPEGDFASAYFGILCEGFATGAPPAPLLNGVASSLDPTAIFMVGPGGISPPPFSLYPLPAGGFDVSVCWPAGLVGGSVLMQTVVVDPSAQNGFFATSSGIALEGV